MWAAAWAAVLVGAVANEADAEASVAAAHLRLQVLGQEVVDLTAHGGNAADALGRERAAISTERAGVERAQRAADARAADEAAAAARLRALQGAELIGQARAYDQRAVALAARSDKEQTRAAFLGQRVGRIAKSVARLEGALAAGDKAQRDLPDEIAAERARTKAKTKAAKATALAQIADLRRKAAAARTQHRRGEVAALRWQEGSVADAYDVTRSRLLAKLRDETVELRQAAVMRPKLQKQLQRVSGKFRRAREIEADVRKDAAADAAGAKNLTAQAALLRIEGRADQGLLSKVTGTVAEAKAAVAAASAATAAADRAAEQRAADAAADEVALELQTAPEPARMVSGGLDATALGAVLGPDTDEY